MMKSTESEAFSVIGMERYDLAEEYAKYALPREERMEGAGRKKKEILEKAIGEFNESLGEVRKGDVPDELSRKVDVLVRIYSNPNAPKKHKKLIAKTLERALSVPNDYLADVIIRSMLEVDHSITSFLIHKVAYDDNEALVLNASRFLANYISSGNCPEGKVKGIVETIKMRMMDFRKLGKDEMARALEECVDAIRQKHRIDILKGKERREDLKQMKLF